MSLFVFQESRQQLLEILMASIDSACRHRDEHIANGEPEGELERQQINGILAAARVAERQVKRLEYWSDVQDLVREGKALTANDHSHGWTEAWKGIDASGPDSRRVESHEKVDDSSTDDVFVTSDGSIRTKTTRHSSDFTDITNSLSRLNTQTIQEDPDREEKATRDTSENQKEESKL
jgi:hypothetical protein